MLPCMRRSEIRMRRIVPLVLFLACVHHPPPPRSGQGAYGRSQIFTDSPCEVVCGLGPRNEANLEICANTPDAPSVAVTCTRTDKKGDFALNLDADSYRLCAPQEYWYGATCDDQVLTVAPGSATRRDHHVMIPGGSEWTDENGESTLSLRWKFPDGGG